MRSPGGRDGSKSNHAVTERLFEASRARLVEWTERLRRETGTRFPEKVTAFRDGMAVHGRYRLPCPDCGAPVQRITYAENETNYCARCRSVTVRYCENPGGDRQVDETSRGRDSSICRR